MDFKGMRNGSSRIIEGFDVKKLDKYNYRITDETLKDGSFVTIMSETQIIPYDKRHIDNDEWNWKEGWRFGQASFEYGVQDTTNHKYNPSQTVGFNTQMEALKFLKKAYDNGNFGSDGFLLFNAETFEAKGYAPDKPFYATTHEIGTTTVMHPIKCGHYKMVMSGMGVWDSPTFYDTIEEMFTDKFDEIMETQAEGMTGDYLDTEIGQEVKRKYQAIKTIGDARKFAKRNYDFKIDFAPCFRKERDYDSKALNALPITVAPIYDDSHFNAETFDVEFNEWADQEMNSHGKNISFKDWADDEGLKHGNSEITDWAQHEDESHDARYGAEWLYEDEDDLWVAYWDWIDEPVILTKKDMNLSMEQKLRVALLNLDFGEVHMETDMGGTAIFVKVKGDKYARRGLDAEELKRDSCCCGATKSNPCACMIQGVMECNATCPCSLEKKGAETFEDSWEKGVIRLAIDSGCFSDEYAEWVSRQIDGASSTLNNPRFKKIIDKRWGLNAENWGGDPEGKLALALQKARDKAKEPKKPLKIEKLGAEHECPHCLSELDGDMVELHESFVCPYCDKEMLSYRIRSVPAYEMGAETSGQWEIGEQLEEAQMNAEEFDRAIEDKKGHINYWNEKDRMQKYFKNWKPKSSPYEKRVVAETKTKWCENCGELDDNDEDNWNWYQWVLKQKNSSKASFRWITGGACQGCGSNLCQNCVDGHTSGQFNPLFDPSCEDCGGAFCKECKDESEDRCDTCQEEYEENVCDCCGYLHHAESFAATKGIDTFTQPFEESSLDSGTVKSVLVGLGIGALALFGYNKWK